MNSQVQLKDNKFSRSEQHFGFTLIELLLVIALLLIITSMGAPFYARFYTQNAVENTTVQLVNSIRKAQIYSMMGKQDSEWGVHVDGSGMTLFKGASYASRNTVFDEKFSVNSNIVISGITDIIFARVSGIPTSTASITISGGGNTENISINSQGIISR